MAAPSQWEVASETPLAPAAPTSAPGPWNSGYVPASPPQQPQAQQNQQDKWQVASEAPLSDDHSVLGFAGNAVKSGAKLGWNAYTTLTGAIEKPIRNALEFATNKTYQPTPEEEQFNNIGDTVAGATHQAFKKFGLGSDADETPQAQSDIAKAQALENQYKQRYGSGKGFKEAAYHDPFGVLADAAMVTGGIAGAAGKTAELADYANLTRPAAELRNISKGASLATEYNPLVAIPGKVVPAAYSAVKKTIGDYVDRVADPHLSMIQALKPTAARVNFDKSVAMAMPDIKAAETATGPITDIKSLLEAVKQAKLTKRAQLEAYTTPAQRQAMTVDLSPVADAMEKSIPDTVRFENLDPVTGAPTGEYKAALERADLYRTTVPIGKAESFLKDTNAALDAYYAKYPGVKYAQLRANPETAALVSKADALRDAFYKGLDNSSHGDIPRSINQRYGALTDIEDSALRRKNVAARLAPDNLTEQFANLATAGRVVQAGIKAVSGHPMQAMGELAHGAAVRGAAKWLKEHQQSNNLVRRAFKNYSVRPKRFFGPDSNINNVAGLYPALPAATSGIGVSGVIAPDMAGIIRTGTNRMMAGPKQLPAATSRIGVSGTIVPDIIGRSSRGQGTPLPLLEGVQGNPPPVQELIWDNVSKTWKQPKPKAPPGLKRQPGGPYGTSQPPSQGAGRERAVPGAGFKVTPPMRKSDVSGPGAKTIDPSTPIPLPPAGTYKNPYRD